MIEESQQIRIQAMIEAVAQQRNQTADMVAQLVGENAVLKRQIEAAKAIATKTLETAQELCRAYDKAVLSNADGCPENDWEVARLRALLGVKD